MQANWQGKAFAAAMLDVRVHDEDTCDIATPFVGGLAVEDGSTSGTVQLITAAKNNTAYRKALVTARNMQIVAMNITPADGDQIPPETHHATTQTLMVVDGTAKVVIQKGDEIVVHTVQPLESITIAPGTRHSIVSTNAERPLKLLSFYAPVEHRYDTIEERRRVAEQ